MKLVAHVSLRALYYKEYHNKRKYNTELIKKNRTQAYKWYLEHKDDPEFKKKQRIRTKAWFEKNREILTSKTE